jgi:hypothetical protein
MQLLLSVRAVSAAADSILLLSANAAACATTDGYGVTVARLDVIVGAASEAQVHPRFVLAMARRSGGPLPSYDSAQGWLGRLRFLRVGAPALLHVSVPVNKQWLAARGAKFDAALSGVPAPHCKSAPCV